MAEEQAAAQDQPQQQFAMQRIYNKDISFESPSSPDVFKKQWQPKINVDLNTRSNPID
ncbi:MAG: protein-export chaperone SecB, partial [Pseudomonadota bacterium]